jgi:uncharacterized protein YcaQ
LHLLSPFDNLIIGRARIRRPFGFDYSLECYLPEARRKHGYFCLPILYGDRFVGRLDPKADRAERTFRIRRLALEPGLREPGAVLAALAKRLRSFAGFQGCDRIVLERAEPARVGSAFRRELGG